MADKKQEDIIKKIIKRSIDASCTIIVEVNLKNDYKRWTGSGFHIGKGFIVTAAHVVSDEPHVIIMASFDSKILYESKVLISSTETDVAILYCPKIIDKIPHVILGDSNTAEVGDIIAVISSPEGWHDTATVGRITNVNQELGAHAPTPAWNDIFFIDADILQGSSGGMVIGTDGLVYGSIMGMTGQYAQIGIGERSVCPSNKIKKTISIIGSNE